MPGRFAGNVARAINVSGALSTQIEKTRWECEIEGEFAGEVHTFGDAHAKVI